MNGELLRRMDTILPYPVVVTAFVVAWAMFLLHRTQFGRHTYAIGGNIDAATRSRHPGRPPHHHALHPLGRDLGHRRLPLDAALYGGLGRHRRPAATSSIAAVIIGGVSMFGGAGTVIGTVIGALIIAVLTTGLVMLNVDAFWQFIVVGTVVIVAVLIDQSRDLITGRARRRGETMSEPLLSIRNVTEDLRRPRRGRRCEPRRPARRGGRRCSATTARASRR